MKKVNEEVISLIDITDDVRLVMETPECQRELNEHPRRLVGGALIRITEGCATISVDITDYTVRKNDLITLLPGAIVQFTGKSSDFSAFYVAFSSTFIYRNFLKRPDPPVSSMINQKPVLQQEELTHTLIYDFLDLLQKVYQREIGKSRSFSARCLTVNVIHEVNDIYKSIHSDVETKPASRQDIIYKRLVALITRNYRKERSIAFYAEQLYLTPKYLSAVVLQNNGRRISDLINRAVIMDAKVQLKSTDLTVQQISDTLNFPDSSVFGKYFKKHTGISPMRYRKTT